MSQPLLPPSPELRRRLAGTPLLVMLDVDGTLAPIAPRPELAIVPDATREAVRVLASQPDVHVALVSGRAAADARRMVGDGDFWVIGNHGMEVVDPRGATRIDEQVAPYRGAIADAARRLAETLAQIEGVIVEDKELSLSVHFRLAPPHELARVSALVSEEGERAGLAVMRGKQVLELRPPVRVHKGTAVRDLAVALGGAEEGSALLYVGDDRTDEDAFAELRREQPAAVTVHVGAGELADGTMTSAEYVVPDTEGVQELLEWLLAKP